MKKLSIGLQSFQDLREKDYIYVDKTNYIYQLINSGKVYFLSRPRRFGKSLLINTFKELFKGNKQIFEGLYIYDKWDWTKKYPVIHL
ncbi:MAG: AAA family ATPase, partial [Endomicrobium sp.]|nr:AAA family ATPase [Endomicrobium sp.]